MCKNDRFWNSIKICLLCFHVKSEWWKNPEMSTLWNSYLFDPFDPKRKDPKPLPREDTGQQKQAMMMIAIVFPPHTVFFFSNYHGSSFPRLLEAIYQWYSISIPETLNDYPRGWYWGWCWCSCKKWKLLVGFASFLLRVRGPVSHLELF